MQQWKNFENRSTFAKVTGTITQLPFWLTVPRNVITLLQSITWLCQCATLRTKHFRMLSNQWDFVLGKYRIRKFKTVFEKDCRQNVKWRSHHSSHLISFCLISSESNGLDRVPCPFHSVQFRWTEVRWDEMRWHEWYERSLSLHLKAQRARVVSSAVGARIEVPKAPSGRNSGSLCTVFSLFWHSIDFHLHSLA